MLSVDKQLLAKVKVGVRFAISVKVRVRVKFRVRIQVNVRAEVSRKLVEMLLIVCRASTDGLSKESVT